MDDLIKELEAHALRFDRRSLRAKNNLLKHLEDNTVNTAAERAAQYEKLRNTVAADARALRAYQKNNVLNNVIRKRAQQIREGTRAIEGMKHLEEAVEGAIDVSTTSIGKNIGDSRILDPRIMIGEIVDEVGQEVVDHAIKNGGEVGQVLGKISLDFSGSPGERTISTRIPLMLWRL